MKKLLIPQKEQFRKWSIPNKVTYIAGWLTFLSLFFSFIFFFYPNEISHENLELNKKNSELLMQIIKLQNEKCNLNRPLDCEEAVKEELGYSINEVKEIIERVKSESKEFIDLGNAEYLLGNYDEAEKWYLKVIGNNEISAHFMLGYLYSKKDWDKKDYEKSFNFYKSAAEKGHFEAQFNLGCLYERGWGVKIDKSKAIEWYTLAGNQGVMDAQYNLGVIYEAGKIADKNIDKAIYWYKKAARQGHLEAKEQLSALGEDWRNRKYHQ